MGVRATGPSQAIAKGSDGDPHWVGANSDDPPPGSSSHTVAASQAPS
jgi:hypothetical protein